MIIEENKLTAEEGFLLQRIADGWIAGKEITLGYTHYMYGCRISMPYLEKPEHYTEIPDPEVIEQ